MRVIYAFLLVLLCTSINAYDFTLYHEKEPFSDSLVYVDFENDSISTISDSYGNISFETDASEAKISIFSDHRYYAKIDLPHAQMVQMTPVASISGFVVDDNENLISSAQLKFICTGDIHSAVPSKSDEIGYFEIDDVGFGKCVINVIKDEKVYSKEIVINQSKEYPVRFVIKGLIFKQSYMFTGLLLGLIFIILVAMFYRLMRGKNRQSDIKKTLMPKDIEIIECIKANGGCVTQSQIRHNTKIPKSSLHRIITSLEQKRILAMKEYDGVKKVELTEWFSKQ